MIDEKIFITCPVTAAPVPTGFRAPQGTDLSALKRVNMRWCPSCHEEHVWNGVDGYWVDDEPEPELSLWDEFRARWRRSSRE
jgi:hypothetical protein